MPLRSSGPNAYIRLVHSPRAARFAVMVLTLALTAASCGDPATNAPLDSGEAPSGPVLPVPSDLWRPTAGATPSLGSYLYVDGDPTFSPRVTLPRSIVPTTGVFAVSATDGTLTISATDTTLGLKVHGVFTMMLGHPLIEEGYYRDLRDAANADPLKGSLDVTIDAHACSSLTGWFAIDHVFYFNGRLTALDLRFEQRCPGFALPMHGQLHWTENLT